jgi:hypothetical protein
MALAVHISPDRMTGIGRIRIEQLHSTHPD